MSELNYALITGASSGIGRAMAEVLGEKGYALLLVSNQAEQLEETAVLFRQKGFRCRSYCLDLSQSEAAFTLYHFCQQEQLVVDVLINNAGMLLFGELTTHSVQQVEAICQLHMHTPVLLCRLFIADMLERQKGYVLNVSSISSVMPYPYISLYGPTKTFIRSYSRALRHEIISYGVTVSCLIPGATATGLYDPKRVNLDLGLRIGLMHRADEVAREGIEGLWKGKAEITPGWLNKLLVYVFPTLPDVVLQWIIRKTSWPQQLRNMLQTPASHQPK
jgi:short-subunit dehydrogenase